MRVVVNLAWLIPGGVGGSEEYAVRLLRAVLDKAPVDLDLSIVGSAALLDAHPELAAADFQPIPGPVRVRPYRVAMESTALHRLTEGADVVHHFGGRLPARHRGNDVITIHDLQPLHLPENFSSTKRRYLGWALPRSVRSARLVTTPSAYVAQTVVDELGASPDRVRVVSSTWAEDSPVDNALADGLGPGPVVLYPAVSHPHKRHALLLEAVDRLVDAHADLTLVLTGAAGRAEADLAALASRSRVRVVRPGRVTAAVLQGLLHRADVVAFPSAYEGFGLPVLEAMHAGTPVVASRSTALVEVSGDAAELVAGSDPSDWTGAIERVLTDPELRRARAAAGRVQAERYAPAVAAASLLAAWRSID